MIRTRCTRILGLAGLLAAALAAVACEEKPPVTKTVLMIFDVSGSTTPDVRDQYITWAKSIIHHEKGKPAHFGPGDALVAIRVTDSSLTEWKTVTIELTRFDPTRENMLVAAGKAAKELDGAEQKIEDFVRDQREVIKYSKIMDALSLAASNFKALKRDRNVLVVFSDMVEESDHYNFAKQPLSDARAQQIVESEKQNGRVPDLKGVKVYVYGAGVGEYAKKLSSQQFRGIESFWLAYFKASGADLPAERYLPSFIGYSD